MQKKNQILERILIIALIIFVVVLTVFIIVERNIKIERENEEAKANSANSSEKTEVKLTQEQAIKVGKELFEEAKKAYWKENIEYVKEQTSGEYDEPLTVMIQGGLYGQIANYNAFINKKFTVNGEQALQTYLGILATKENEESENIIYYIPLADRGGDISYIDTELKVLTISADEIRFNAVSRYYAGDTEYNPNELSSDIQTEEKTNLFVIKKSEKDNKWKIETFTLPN